MEEEPQMLASANSLLLREIHIQIMLSITSSPETDENWSVGGGGLWESESLGTNDRVHTAEVTLQHQLASRTNPSHVHL